MQKLLVAVDGSDYTSKVIDMAKKISNNTNCKITLVTVLNTPDFLGPFAETSIEYMEKDISKEEELKQKAEKHGENILKEVADIINNQNLVISKKVLYGNPAHEICELAKINGFDLIIVGEKGKNKASKFLLGSIATKVVRYAPCSVLVVK